MTSATHVRPAPVYTAVGTPSKTVRWTGRVLSALPVAIMVFAGIMKLVHAPQMVASWVNRMGWPERLMTPVALIELGSAILFVIPRTAVLGAILVSCHLAAAFSTHLRIGDTGGGMVPLLLGALAWLGLYLREERLHVLLPLRGMRRETGSS